MGVFTPRPRGHPYRKGMSLGAIQRKMVVPATGGEFPQVVWFGYTQTPRQVQPDSDRRVEVRFLLS